MYVKTIATLGPASESGSMIETLIDSGMDIARFNFSHTNKEEVYSRSQKVREISRQKGKQVQLLQDLCGRRIRLGRLPEGGQEIQGGEKITFYTLGAPDPSPGEIPIGDDTLHHDLKPGNTLLIESGRFNVDVIEVDETKRRIVATVQKGGILHSNKGVNVPYIKLTSPALTPKDRKDLELGKELDFEYVALSFVQSVGDLEELRRLIKPNQKIIAKVEDPLGVENIDEIIRTCDGIMIGRGDLGVEMPLEEVPFIQKEIIAKCRYAHKPAIVATQMLLSMVYNPSPTRAEVSDVANAVLDGTDAVMLSDETAVGDYPTQAVEMLVKIVERTEKFLYDRPNTFETGAGV